jgi:hypothetical protein
MVEDVQLARKEPAEWRAKGQQLTGLFPSLITVRWDTPAPGTNGSLPLLDFELS